MSEFKQYIRVNVAEMRTYVPFENMENISVSDADRKGTFEGGFIARDPKNHKDQWFVSAKYFAENFSEQPAEIQEGTPEGTPKTYHNSEASGARKNVKDIQFWGNGDMWRLLSKASSKSENWMKSTKCLELQHGCLVQVTTQQGDHVAEAITFVPAAYIIEDFAEDGTVVGRRLSTAPTTV